jgi:hypothetical protein
MIDDLIDEMNNYIYHTVRTTPVYNRRSIGTWAK